MRFPLIAFASSLLCILSVAGSAAEIPRPEHPEPQFVRQQWLNLNGEWEFAFDDENAGLEQEWWKPGQGEFPRKITVPFAPESEMSGIGDTSFHRQVWYRREFDVPAAWEGKRVLLHFGAVDYRAKVWVNGQFAGGHEGGQTPFALDVTGLVEAEGNVLVVRAEDYPTDRYIPRGKQYWRPKSASIFYTRTTGIWQTVWLEAAGQTYLKKVRVTADPYSGEARFTVRLNEPAGGLTFAAEVSFDGEEQAAGTVEVNSVRGELALTIPNPRTWRPGQPNLYDVAYELRRDGETLDRVQSYFGMRRIEVQQGRFLINRRPTELRTVLDQGYWPESVLTPPSDEAIRYDIEKSMEMGFNGARKHQKIEDPRYLYWADKLGFLVSGEIGNAYLYDAEYAAGFTREWIEAVERDVNHPSVVMWVPINESWGVPDLSDPRQQMHLESLYALTHSLDGTRPVIDNDGWEHTDHTDLFSVHDYSRDGETLYNVYKGWKPGEPIGFTNRPRLIEGYEYNGTPFFMSEYGGIAYIPPDAEAPEDAWGYAETEKTPEAFYERMRGLTEAVRKLPNFVGFCYTQLTDVEQETNGLMTYDRKMKFPAEKIREIINP